MHRCTRYLHFPSFALRALLLSPYIDTCTHRRAKCSGGRTVCTAGRALFTVCLYLPRMKVKHLIVRYHCFPFSQIVLNVHQSAETRPNDWTRCLTPLHVRCSHIPAWQPYSCEVTQSACLSVCACVCRCVTYVVRWCTDLSSAWPCSWTLYLLECWNCLMASSS